MLDESSLASTKQLHAFLHRLGPDDRVLLVGDVRQHQSVDAGRPYQQLQEAGMETARLDAIVRQRDPALRAIVEQLARGDVRGAVHQLDGQGRVHEITDREERLAAIAREYLRQPDRTLIVSPDNRSRLEINHVIHQARQTEGQVAAQERHVRVLVARQEVTGADRQWAAHYHPGDVVRYTKGSHTYRLAAGEYARVVQVNAEENHVTVRRAHGPRVTYDPRRLFGVTLYREADRARSPPATASSSPRPSASATSRTVSSARSRRYRPRASSTSASIQAGPSPSTSAPIPTWTTATPSRATAGQGQTADRVLVHIDLERAGEQLVNQRLAYVAVSRGRYDAQIYTNDKTHLVEALCREVSHRSALKPGHGLESAAQARTPTQRVSDRSLVRIGTMNQREPPQAPR